MTAKGRLGMGENDLGIKEKAKSSGIWACNERLGENEVKVLEGLENM